MASIKLDKTKPTPNQRLCFVLEIHTIFEWSWINKFKFIVFLATVLFMSKTAHLLLSMPYTCRNLETPHPDVHNRIDSLVAQAYVEWVVRLMGAHNPTMPKNRKLPQWVVDEWNHVPNLWVTFDWLAPYHPKSWIPPWLRDHQLLPWYTFIKG